MAVFGKREKRGHFTYLNRKRQAVEQNARCALEVSHRTYVFEIGRIALSGDSKSLSEDPRIKKAYLGA